MWNRFNCIRTHTDFCSQIRNNNCSTSWHHFGYDKITRFNFTS